MTRQWYDLQGRRYCSGHRRYLSISAFGPDASERAPHDGLDHYCRECRAAHSRQWMREDRAAQRILAWLDANAHS